MKNFAYLVGNGLVGMFVIGFAGLALYANAPALCAAGDSVFLSIGFAATPIVILVVGFVTLETRKA